jgi:Rieske 2Fe-2S family protein
MEKVQGFREGDHPLGRVATAVWDGHVFINLAAEPRPFSEHLAGLDVKFRPWGMEALKLVERRTYHLRANWKLVIQNYSECLHCPIVHPLLNRQSHYMSGENEPPRPTYLGGRMDLRDGMQTLSLDGQTNRAPLPGLSSEDCRHVYYYALLPNLLLNLHPDYMLTFALWPKASTARTSSASGTSIRTRSRSPDSIRRGRSSSGTSPIARTGSCPISRRRA